MLAGGGLAGVSKTAIWPGKQQEQGNRWPQVAKIPRTSKDPLKLRQRDLLVRFSFSLIYFKKALDLRYPLGLSLDPLTSLTYLEGVYSWYFCLITQVSFIQY